MSNIYHDLIIDHYKNPRNFGVLENPDAVVQEANASCGDLIEFQIKIKKTENRKSCEAGSRSAGQEAMIGEISWRGVGCAISTAAASLLSERVQSSEFRVQDILKLTDKDMTKMLGGGISHARIKCATLPLVALQKAINNFQPKADPPLAETI